VVAELPAERDHAGICRQPWMCDLYGRRDRVSASRTRHAGSLSRPIAFGGLDHCDTDATIGYLAGQIEAGRAGGAALRRWAGSLAPSSSSAGRNAPTATIVRVLKARYPTLARDRFCQGGRGQDGGDAR